ATRAGPPGPARSQPPRRLRIRAWPALQVTAPRGMRRRSRSVRRSPSRRGSATVELTSFPGRHARSREARAAMAIATDRRRPLAYTPKRANTALMEGARNALAPPGCPLQPASGVGLGAFHELHLARHDLRRLRHQRGEVLFDVVRRGLRGLGGPGRGRKAADG